MRLLAGFLLPLMLIAPAAAQGKISLSVTGRTGCLRFGLGDYAIHKVLKKIRCAKAARISGSCR